MSTAESKPKKAVAKEASAKKKRRRVVSASTRVEPEVTAAEFAGAVNIIWKLVTTIARKARLPTAITSLSAGFTMRAFDWHPEISTILIVVGFAALGAVLGRFVEPVVNALAPILVERVVQWRDKHRLTNELIQLRVEDRIRIANDADEEEEDVVEAESIPPRTTSHGG